MRPSAAAMMRGGAIALCAAAGAWLVLAPAAAAPADDAKICGTSGENAIAACTRAIASGAFSGHNAAVLYVDRAIEHALAGEVERAIADYSEAIRIDANFAAAYYGRAMVRYPEGGLAGVIADLSRASAIEPTNATYRRALDDAHGMQAALAPGAGPYLADARLDDAFAGVQAAIEAPPSVDDLYGTIEGRPQLHGPSEEKAKRAIWLQMRPLINKTGMDPAAAIIDAIRGNRIVGIGEQHTKAVNLAIVYAINHMREFAAAGVTDFFVEAPTAAQPIFDRFNANAAARAGLEIPDRPDELIRPGVEPVVAAGTIQFLRGLRRNSPQYFALWRAAKAAGIRVHAIDNDAEALAFSAPDDRRLGALIAARDRDMAANMLAVMNEPGASRPRKGLAWLGAGHLIGANKELPDKRAFLLLREKGVPVATFFAAIAVNELSAKEALFTVGRYVNRAVAVATHDGRGAPNALGVIRSFPGAVNPPIAAWDFAIIFPHHCALAIGQDQKQRLAC